MSRQYPGYFITLEGPEGCGKSSQKQPLIEMLEQKGLTVCFTREPGGTPIGEQIRAVIISLQNTEMHPRTEGLLFQAARAQIVEQLIRPRLQQGEVVISDRFFDSTFAYQGYGHGQKISDIKMLTEYATGGLVPDLTVLMDVDVEVGLNRKGKSVEWNRLDAFARDFHQKVRDGYLEMARQDPNRWVIIDANQSVEEVSRDFKREIENKLIFNGLIEGNKGGAEIGR